jgi:hypothetical protein
VNAPRWQDDSANWGCLYHCDLNQANLRWIYSGLDGIALQSGVIT